MSDFIEIEGSNAVLLTAPHAEPPKSDYLTGFLVEKIALGSKSHGLISKTSRTVLDLNSVDGMNHPFRGKISEIIEKEHIKLILDIHGAKNEYGVSQIELGIANGKTAKKKTVTQLKSELEKNQFDVSIDNIFKGEKKRDNIINYYSRKYNSLECIQVEIRKDIRDSYNNKLNDLINSMITYIQSYY